MYPNDMPPPEGMSNRQSMKESWMFRRNYTWSVIDNSAQANQWWGTTGHTFATAGYSGPPGSDSILCALNTFGQNDVFKLPSEWNGYCVRNEKYTVRSAGWQNVPRTSRCLITFGSSTTKKRSEADHEGWEVLSKF
jgi:hypothetical protein